MNSPDLLTPWLAPLGWLALEAAVVVLAALALQPFLRTAAVRRSLWRAALLALVAVLVAELTGTGSQLPAQLRLAWQTTFPAPIPPPALTPAPEQLTFIPPPGFSLAPIGGEGAVPTSEPLQFEPVPSLPPAPLSLSHFPTLPPAPSPLPAFLWLAGLAALLTRTAWTHAGFAWLRFRHFLPAAEALRECVHTLAARLGLRRRVRVLTSERLHAPVAFGWLRPGVGVPGDFTARFAPAQQDVMLAHELAHLAARDPLWQLLADFATAALWWHPLAWVARRQHRLAGELAADDASQALPDGPIVLAECLLAYGHAATDCPRAALGMAGFRSQLGHRVERLVALPRRDWQAPSRTRLALQTAVALLALAALALLPGCAANRTAGEAPPRLLAHWWQAKKAPVAADVRRLQSNAERGMRNAESSQRLVTAPPTNAIDISVGRQLFVDDFLIASNTLKRTWHHPVLFSTAPLLAVHNQLPPVSQFFESVWFEPTDQHFKLGLAHGVRFFRDFHSPSGTNWLALNSQSHSGPLVELPHKQVTTDYENLRVTLSRGVGADGIRFGFARTGAEPVPQAGQPVIPLPAPTDGSRWTDMHPLRNGFLVVGRSLYFYFGGQVTNHGPPVRVPGFPQQQVAAGLATLRRDGFASLDAGPEGGVLTTKPVTFTGRFMFLNWKTNTPDGELRVEILDANAGQADGAPLRQGYSIPNDQTLINVIWQDSPGTNDLSAFTNRPVRFRFHLKNASLYSFWVGPGQLGRSMGRVAGGGPHFTNDVDTIGNRSYQSFLVKPLPPPKAGTLTVGDYLRTEVTYRQGTTNHTLRLGGQVAPAGYFPLPRLKRAVVVAGKTIEEAQASIREGYLESGFEAVEVKLTKADPPPPAPKLPEPRGALPAPAPSPFAERGEKVAEGRLRGAATNAVAANPSPQPSPLAPQRAREREGAAPIGDDVRSLTSPAAVSNQQSEVSQRLVTSSPTTLQAAEAEAARRQERKVALDKLLGEAGQFQKVKSWTNAVMRYEEAVGHAKVLGGVETVEKQYRDALAGLTHCRIQLAVALQEKYEFKAAAAEVDKILPFAPRSAEAEQFKRFNERVEAAHKNRPAPRTPPAERAEVLRLVRDGRLHYEMGDLQKARTLLEEAIAKDPVNEAAYYYLRLIQESQFERESKVREKTYSDRVVEVTKKWNEKARADLPVPNPYYRTNSEVPFLTHSSKGAQRINRKLEEIVLPEVHFDGVPLAEVVKRLSADAAKFDPEKKGLNFLINDVSPQLPLLDAAGNPVPAARPVLLSEGLIRVGQPLKNLTLRQALDVICKTAELPTQFSVEEYAIAFIPRGPVAYFSRTFRVNPDTFMQGLQGVVANPVLGVTVGGGNAAGAAGQNQPANSTTTTGPLRATVPATVPATQRTAAEANALVRQFFRSAGVTSLGATNGSTRVTFNPENGLLLVRGTTNDLRVIEQAIQKVQPPLLTPTNAAPAAPTNALPKPNVIYRTNNSAPFLTHSGKGAQRINAKLDEIILPEIHFDSVSLPAVVTWLDGSVKKHDPEKKGLNFLINNVVSDYISLNDAKAGKPAAPVLDPMGNPIVSPAVKPARPDLENALIKVTRPIKDLTLRQVLDVICKTATVKMPDGRTAGLKFTVEEYAIVFSPKLPEQASLFARTFKVDPETFIRGMASVVFDDKRVRDRGQAAVDQALREKAWTNAPAGIKQFSVGGIPVGSGVVSAGNTNVTAELNNLLRIYFRAAGVSELGVTNGPDATQVFFNDRNGLLLVRASLEDLDIIQMAIELLNVKPPQVLIEAKFVAIDQNDNKAVGFDWSLGDVRFDKSSPTNKPDSANPVGIFPRPALPSGASGSTGSLTNKLVRTNAASVATITGILTAPQFAVVMRALEQRDAASVRSLPKVTTPPGKLAVLELPAAAKAEGGFAQGLKLEVLPSVEANGYTISFTVIVTRDGKRVLESRGIVWDAQTLMVGGLELPGAAAKPGAKPPRLVLFLTPTLVDVAGNRIHATTDEMPFAPAGAPQPAAPGKR